MQIKILLNSEKTKSEGVFDCKSPDNGAKDADDRICIFFLKWNFGYVCMVTVPMH